MIRRMFALILSVVLSALILNDACAAGEDGKCLRCGGACSHQWEIADSRPATCTEEGFERARCRLCGKEKTKKIPALGHEWGICTMVQKPTCTEDGIIRCFCMRDERHYEDKVQPATGHKWGEWFTLREATLTKPGMKEQRCERCGEVRQQQLPALVQREEYGLMLFVTHRQDGAAGYECALVNSGKRDLWIREFSTGEEEGQLDERVKLPAGQVTILPIAKAVRCFYGETEAGERVCTSNLPAPAEEKAATQSTSSLRLTQNLDIGTGICYRMNETIGYTVEIMNTGAETITRIILQGLAGEEEITDLRQGETQVLRREYQVSRQDVINGYIYWTTTARIDGEPTATAQSNALIAAVAEPE